MILKFVTKNGTKIYGPPYTKKEEADFYRRNANGPVTIARGADAKGRKSHTRPKASMNATPSGDLTPKPGIRKQNLPISDEQMAMNA
jgi:hypothetical protein